jgi:NAD dependent epimerase/dehydratase family enzyme
MTQRVVVIGATGHIGRPLCRELLRAGNLEQAGFDGPVNLTAPTPVRAREFARVLGRAVGRRAWLPVPTPFVRMGLGVITDILVRGKRVIPAGASELGYRFRFPVLDLGLHDLLGQPDDKSVAAR